MGRPMRKQATWGTLNRLKFKRDSMSKMRRTIQAKALELDLSNNKPVSFISRSRLKDNSKNFLWDRNYSVYSVYSPVWISDNRFDPGNSEMFICST